MVVSQIEVCPTATRRELLIKHDLGDTQDGVYRIEGEGEQGVVIATREPPRLHFWPVSNLENMSEVIGKAQELLALFQQPNPDKQRITKLQEKLERYSPNND